MASLLEDTKLDSVEHKACVREYFIIKRLIYFQWCFNSYLFKMLNIGDQ